MRKSIIIPLFKKGNRMDCTNYRGISLLSIAGKVLTSLLRTRLNDLYESTLREQQGGFRMALERKGLIRFFRCDNPLKEEYAMANQPLCVSSISPLLLIVRTEIRCGRFCAYVVFPIFLLTFSWISIVDLHHVSGPRMGSLTFS